MLTIRLQRTGRKNQPSFRIVLAEKHRHVSKKALEVLGFYVPSTKEFSIKDEERLQYWLGQNVELSPTINNLLVEKGLLKGEKVKAWRPKAKDEPEESQKEPSVSTGEVEKDTDKPAEDSTDIATEKAEKEEESSESEKTTATEEEVKPEAEEEKKEESNEKAESGSAPEENSDSNSEESAEKEQ